MIQCFISFAKDEEGATAIEYGLIAALVSVAAIGALTAMGNSLGTMFNTVSSALWRGGRVGMGLGVHRRAATGEVVCERRLRPPRMPLLICTRVFKSMTHKAASSCVQLA
jgi:pilus assembly protein Flp/PilA